MIKIIADTHTHTLACDHAYSTLSKNISAAAAKGLDFLCLTEHAPAMPGAPSFLHFECMRTIPRKINGVIILKGAEVNIIDYNGGVDLEPHILNKLDWVIASLHTPCIAPSTVKDHTNAWMAIAANPDIDVIGHCGDARYPFEEDIVLKEFARQNKIVEINSHSFSVRPGSAENCTRIAKKCMELGIKIVISSDSHHCSNIGSVGKSIKMIEEIGYPEELILNIDYNRFLAVAREKSGESLTE